MSEVDGRFVKLGLWTNLDQGNVMGKTITTDSTTGAIVIALMAVLSTMGTSYLWSIFLFVYHQIRANGRPADGLFHQQQALLRTLLPPSSLMAESTKLWWCWRRKNDKVLVRSLIQFLLAASCTIGFIAASITSSFVVSTSNLEVMVHSSLCGTIGDIPVADVARGVMSSIKAVSVPYAEECYQDQDVPPARCKVYKSPQIKFSTEKAPCPFETKFCAGNASSTGFAIALDSGLVDLNAGFGLNLPKKDRVSYRRRTTCTVLPLGGHTSIINASEFPDDQQTVPDIIPDEKFLLLYYGERLKVDQWKNVTVVYSLLRGNFTRGYTLRGSVYFGELDRNGKGNSFLPLEGMRRTDADVVVKALFSTVQYTYPVEDPWFSAHRPVRSIDSNNGHEVTMYAPDSPLTALGCAVQHQFCIKTTAGERCSELDTMPLNINPEDWKEASPLQLSALQLTSLVIQYIHFAAIDSVKVNGFATEDSIVGAQIPPDQWVHEIERMEAIVWASSQVSVADFAVGPSVRNPAIAEYIIGPTSEGDKELCQSLKVRKAGGFVNINVFGMSFVIATALLFAIIDTVLLRFLIYLSTFRKALSPRIDRWIQDGVLQLQRRAFEAHKEGTWSGLSKEVPLTDAKELLAELPLASLPSANTSTVSTPASGSQSSSAAQPQSNPAPAIITQPTPPQSSPPQPIIHQPTPPQPTSSQSSPPQSPLQQSSLPQPTPPQPIQPRSATHSPVNQGANTPTPLSPSSTP